MEGGLYVTGKGEESCVSAWEGLGNWAEAGRTGVFTPELEERGHLGQRRP